MSLLIIELGVIALFLLCLFNARKSVKKLGLLFLGAIYATIFENCNVLLSAGKIGGYFYSSSINLFIGQVPLFVILAWAVLIYTTYNLVNYIGISEKRKPFADAFLITLIDLAVDPIATRFGFWNWNNYNLIDGFFGVPGNNFLGWLIVSFAFMWVFRKIENSKFNARKTLFVLSPILGYGLFLLIFGIINWIEKVLFFGKRGEVVLFFIIYLLFFFLMRQEKFRMKCSIKDILFIYAARGTFYLFALFGLIYLEVFNSEGMVVLGFFAILFAELGVYLRFVRGKCTAH